MIDKNYLKVGRRIIWIGEEYPNSSCNNAAAKIMAVGDDHFIVEWEQAELNSINRKVFNSDSVYDLRYWIPAP